MRKRIAAFLAVASFVLVVPVTAQAVTLHVHKTIQYEQVVGHDSEGLITVAKQREIMRVQRVAPEPEPVVVVSSGYAIPESVVMCESGGDPTIVNTTNSDRPAGLYQIITSTWLANGGGAYAPTADLATPEQQSEIAANVAAAAGGLSPWECAQ